MSPPLLVISPHLDDAALSCGGLLAAHPGAVVCTVFTAPARHDQTTDWDRASGFANALEATEARKQEDRQAMAILGARAVYLPFYDSQYDATPRQETLIAALQAIMQDVRPREVFFPLGLFHSDHLLVSDAVLVMLEEGAAKNFNVYEDVPYRRMSGAVQDRLVKLAQRGYVADPFNLPGAAGEPCTEREEAKRKAIHEYRSQLRAFGPDGQSGLYSSEHFWHLRVA